MTLAYSTAGSGTHITALRFMKDYGFAGEARPPPATCRRPSLGDVGQVDIGFSTPPFGLEAPKDGKIRIDRARQRSASIRNQTVRLIIANATDLAKRRDVYDRFITAYRETIDWMYSDPKAIEAFGKYAWHPAGERADRARPVLSEDDAAVDEVKGMPELMQDAIAFKYIPAALTPQQLDELLQLPKK